MEHDVLGLQVVVDHLLGQLVQVLYGIDDLLDDHLRLLLRQSLVLLQVVGQVRPLAVLQHRAEGILVDLYSAVQFHYVGMVQHLVHALFSHCVLDESVLELGAPLWTQLVQLTGHLSQLLCVECLVDLAEAAFAQEPQQLVLPDLGPHAGAGLGV